MIDNTDAQSWYLLGRCYMSQAKYPKAYEAYQQAVYRDGRNPTFWCSIGVLYYQINQYRDALDAYSRAIRLNPYISEVWYDLGTLVSSQIPQITTTEETDLLSSTSPATTKFLMPSTRTVVLPIWIRPTSTSKHACSSSRVSCQAATRPMPRLLNLRMFTLRPTRLVLEDLPLLSGVHRHRLVVLLPSPPHHRGRSLIGTVASTNFNLRPRLKPRRLMDLTTGMRFELPQLFSNPAHARSQEGASPTLFVLRLPQLVPRRLHWPVRECTRLHMHFLRLPTRRLHRLTSVSLVVLAVFLRQLEDRYLPLPQGPLLLLARLMVLLLLAALYPLIIAHSLLRLRLGLSVMNDPRLLVPLTHISSFIMVLVCLLYRVLAALELRAVPPRLHLPSLPPRPLLVNVKIVPHLQ